MPKIWDETIADHREKLRRQIIESAMGLVAELGVMNVTMSAVARRAGIGRATLYNYFPDLEHILAAHVVDEVVGFNRSLADDLRSMPSAADRLHHYLSAMVDYFASPRHAMSVEGTGAMMPEANDEVRAAFLELHQLLVQILRDGVKQKVFRRDLDPALTAELVNGLMGGTRHVLLQGRAEPKAVKKATWQLVCRGVERA